MPPVPLHAANERCRGMLNKAVDDTIECLDAFRLSKYNKDSFLRKFLLEERKAAKITEAVPALPETYKALHCPLKMRLHNTYRDSYALL